MLKVLIADDEEKICQLILKLIDWELLGLEVFRTVSNGLDAIMAVEEGRPEIVITDIRMPGIDGMELIKRVKEVSPMTEVIIISGYRHFEYAQTAIRYGVRNYLLKPIRKDELNETLRKIRDHYREKNEQLNFEERVRLALKNDAGRLRSGFISQLVYNTPDTNKYTTPEDVNSHYHFHFSWGIFQVMGIKFDQIGHDDGNLTFLADKATDLTAQLLESHCFDCELYVECTNIYILVNYSQEEQKDVRKAARGLLDGLKQLESILKGMKVTLGLGKAVGSVNEIRESFEDARLMLQQRIVSGTGRVIEDMGRGTAVFTDSEAFLRFQKALERAIEGLNVMEVRSVVYGLRDTVAATPGMSGHEILHICGEVCRSYLHYMKTKQITVENEKSFLEIFYKNVDDCPDADKVFSHLSGTLCTSFKHAAEAKRAEDNKPIRMAKEYIQENYMRQVTLEDVSALVGFAPGYLSTLFKKETGMPFLEFIQTVRMDAAKKLLTSTDHSMRMVCEEVGYLDVKYFTKCFIKYTGLKPGEYRKIYS